MWVWSVPTRVRNLLQPDKIKSKSLEKRSRERKHVSCDLLFCLHIVVVLNIKLRGVFIYTITCRSYLDNYTVWLQILIYDIAKYSYKLKKKDSLLHLDELYIDPRFIGNEQFASLNIVIVIFNSVHECIRYLVVFYSNIATFALASLLWVLTVFVCRDRYTRIEGPFPDDHTVLSISYEIDS